MDPPTADLAGITTLAQALAWSGVEEPLRDALFGETGRINLIREVTLIDKADWDAAVTAARLTPGGGAERVLKPVEKARLSSLITSCRTPCPPDQVVVEV